MLAIVDLETFPQYPGNAVPVVSLPRNSREMLSVQWRNCQRIRNLLYQRVDCVVERQFHSGSDFFGQLLASHPSLEIHILIWDMA